MKEFITAAQEAAAEDDLDQMVEFKVDGQLCYADKMPGDGQVAIWMATTNSNSATEEQIAGTINFFFSVLEDRTRTLLAAKLLDRRDTFGVREVQDILTYLVEEWSARPTVSPSGSTPSRPSTGPSSTPPTRDLTSSGSRSIAS